MFILSTRRIIRHVSEQGSNEDVGFILARGDETLEVHFFLKVENVDICCCFSLLRRTFVCIVSYLDSLPETHTHTRAHAQHMVYDRGSRAHAKGKTTNHKPQTYICMSALMHKELS